MKKMQKEIADLYDIGQFKESYEKEKEVIDLLIEREKQTTNDAKTLKRLLKNKTKLDDKIAKVGVPLSASLENQVYQMRKNYGMDKVPNPAKITLRMEGAKYMIDKLVVTFIDNRIIFTHDDGTFYQRVDPSPEYLKLLVINDATVLEKDTAIKPEDVKDYLFDMTQIHVSEKGRSDKATWLKKFSGAGLKKAKKPAKKPAKKTPKKPAKKSTGAVNHYKNPKELITRMKILVGEQRGGNNSPDVINEIAELADELLKGDVITKAEHRVIYSKYVL